MRKKPSLSSFLVFLTSTGLKLYDLLCIEQEQDIVRVTANGQQEITPGAHHVEALLIVRFSNQVNFSNLCNLTLLRLPSRVATADSRVSTGEHCYTRLRHSLRLGTGANVALFQQSRCLSRVVPSHRRARTEACLFTDVASHAKADANPL